MKGVKGKFLNTLKTIKTIEHLKPERIFNVYAADGFIDHFFAKSSNNKDEINLISKKEVMQIENGSSVSVQEHEIIDVSEKDLEDNDGSDTDSVVDDKENFQPVSFGANSLSKIDISSFRPPDLDSSTLFDPNLLAAFKQAVMEVKAQEEGRRKRVLRNIEDEFRQDQDQDPHDERPSKSLKSEETSNPLLGYEKIYPPGGCDSVILYTTGVRSIRKTFEDCSRVQFLLKSFGVLYQERDLSMHMGFRDELFRIMGEKLAPPRLFIKGRYIGGAEEVLRLHEQGIFRSLLVGIPLNTSDGPCEGCGGMRFVVCFSCSGSRKVYSSDGWLPEKCKECNENGLIICPFCN